MSPEMGAPSSVDSWVDQAVRTLCRNEPATPTFTQSGPPYLRGAFQCITTVIGAEPSSSALTFTRNRWPSRVTRN